MHRIDSLQFQESHQFSGSQSLMLAKDSQYDSLALREVVDLIGLVDKINYLGIENAPLNSHDHPIRPFTQFRNRSALGEQDLVNFIESASFAFH